MQPSGFEFFEHTADVGIRAWGPTLAEAFAQAARGLIANMVELEGAEASEERRVEAEAENVERLLYHFLDEVLFMFQTEEWVPLDFSVEIIGDTKLVATLRGEPYDAARHGHVHEIKAITFHEMDVQRAPPEVRVIVDI